MEKRKKCNQWDFAYSDPSYLSKHLKSHSGEKSNKCNKCDFSSIRANKNAINATLPVLIQDIWENIWNHTVEKSQINATNVTLSLFGQTIWGDISKHTVEKSKKMQSM